jgi:hypothetical protein
MPTPAQLLAAAPATFGIAALVLNIAASGLTEDTINASIQAAASGPDASPEDYLTVASVFFATLPIVLAFLVSAYVIVTNKLTGFPALGAIVVCFGIAVAITSAVIDDRLDSYSTLEASTATPDAPGPFKLLAWEFKYLSTAYGAKLFVQGLLLGVVLCGAYAYYTDKWKKESEQAN